MISVGNRIYMVSSSARFGAISSSCRAMYFLTWAVVFSFITDAKICSASWIVIWLASCLIDGTNAGLMLNRRRPMPSRSTNAIGWPAISPQSVTGLPASLQVWITCLRIRSTGGASGWQRWLTFGLSRSAAIRYWQQKRGWQQKRLAAEKGTQLIFTVHLLPFMLSFSHASSTKASLSVVVFGRMSAADVASPTSIPCNASSLSNLPSPRRA